MFLQPEREPRSSFAEGHQACRTVGEEALEGQVVVSWGVRGEGLDPSLSAALYLAFLSLHFLVAKIELSAQREKESRAGSRGTSECRLFLKIRFKERKRLSTKQVRGRLRLRPIPWTPGSWSRTLFPALTEGVPTGAPPAASPSSSYLWFSLYLKLPHHLSRSLRKGSNLDSFFSFPCPHRSPPGSWSGLPFLC